jgi:hypothetical protein
LNDRPTSSAFLLALTIVIHRDATLHGEIGHARDAYAMAFLGRC